MRRAFYAFSGTWVIVLAAVAAHPYALAPQQPAAAPRAAAPSRQSSAPAPVRAATAPATPAAHGALLNQYCVTCHNQRTKTADVALDMVNLNDIPADAEVWEKVIKKVRAGMMPPVGMPRPDQAALDALVTHLETTIDKATLAAPVLRRPTMHRLNRSEYGNA